MIDQLEYNTERKRLIIPEYGRHIQKMINQALDTEDDVERNKIAKSIIGVMGNMQPHLRDVPDFQHKLWDQLFIMADFALDVDSPYPKPSREVLQERPEPLGYPQNFPKYRFYGNNIKRMIDVANSWEDGEKKEALEYAIANHMKKCYLNWNKDTVDDYVIFRHLLVLSNGEIDLAAREEDLSDASSLLKQKKKFVSSSNKNQQRSKSNNNRSNRKRY
ncbi:DUF4290 domain-containing protein [Kordia sp. YSTF-M3]|uniref:DUF4290 domain-containing protein n=1 Tax=Kordia aestuariivivens TaxID=2759037 RepID=A0ABR7Q615_9FLAO|nr:DUF4290 domain-containing protein [Kordia aestuariivivens]MBC8754002.1 DUF4290 domain-containing protein [Kordia aestuariivivens]